MWRLMDHLDVVLLPNFFDNVAIDVSSDSAFGGSILALLAVWVVYVESRNLGT